ncbi:hypothetical protein B0H14DRAFT_3851767 [Mycena olivaceomarginata]|nr:hypothetical protein B0H14DRAFT_3851767 [Mycena olivaceomarginata]
MTAQAEQVRARIAKLETEIDLQREVLRNLENDKRLAQRYLNTILDPLARLPLEISSEIFLQTLDAPFPEPGALRVPMLLLSICHAWTDIALSTPALWVAIDILFPATQGLKELLPIWFGRAKNRPLSISLSGGRFDQDITSVIWSHRQRLKHLEIADVDGDVQSEMGIRSLWGGTSLGPLSSLRTLTIRGMGVWEDVGDDEWSPEPFSLCLILELLRLSPDLIECLFSQMEIFNLDDVDANEILVLPKLRRLTLDGPSTHPHFGGVVLKHLSLPGLEVLSASLPDRGVDDNMFSFLQRSSPPLRELISHSETLDPVHLVAYLGLVPDLKRFELQNTPGQVKEELLAVLADSPSLVPHLTTVVIHLHPISDSFWTALLRPLAARPTQVFHLMVPFRLSASQMPAPDLITAFKKLAVDRPRVLVKAVLEPWEHAFD